MPGTTRDARSLIINFGDLPGLSALATRDRPERCVLWHPIEPIEATARRQQVAAEQSVIFSIDEIIHFDCEQQFLERLVDGLPAIHDACEFPLLPVRPEQPIQAGPWSIMLMHAALDARRFGCRQIIWPIHLGDAGIEAQSHAVELQTLICHLIDLDRNHETVGIDLPFLDLNDTQIVDLVSRTEVTLRAAWWCEHAELRPCGGCDSCLRWERAFREAGIGDPWKDSVLI